MRRPPRSVTQRRSTAAPSLARKAKVLAGLGIAAAGLMILVLHSVGAALTEHAWQFVSQVMLFGGAFFVVAQLLGRSKRSRH
ncbi:MAG: hypothetical protein ACRDGN_11285 [bacterium]